jgi:ribosomal protein S18 acetylase RimI-like enzyme
MQTLGQYMRIRTGNIAEFYGFISKVPELNQNYPSRHYRTRLEGKVSLILIAETNSEICGFKVGYGIDDKTFYSWVGGVSPKYRRVGVAQALLDTQESWVWANDFRTIRVKTSLKYPAMIRFLESNEYKLHERIEDALLYSKHRPNKGFNRTPESSRPAKPGEFGGGAG